MEIKIALNEGIGLEQVIKCTNDTTKNAVRLCDDCDLPFCAECLRKNYLSFYYCQNCYPALFMNAVAPVYVRMEEKIDYNQYLTAFVIGSIFYLVLSLIFINLKNLPSYIADNYINILIIFIALYFFTGFVMGKYYPRSSWKVGILLTIQWVIYFFLDPGISILLIALGLIYFISAFIGIYLGKLFNGSIFRG